MHILLNKDDDLVDLMNKFGPDAEITLYTGDRPMMNEYEEYLIEELEEDDIHRIALINGYIVTRL